jgi:hypothetical protein
VDIKVEWPILKQRIDATILSSLQWVEYGNKYVVIAIDGNLTIISELDKQFSPSEEIQDFEDNYKPHGNKKIQAVNIDGRQIIQNTPRYIGTTTCFAGAGDDTSDMRKVWGDDGDISYLELHHEIGQATEQTVYFDLNLANNKGYVFSGLVQFKDAKNDSLDCYVVPAVTPTHGAGSGTYFNLYGGYLIVPAAGDGTLVVNPTEIKLVDVGLNEFGDKSGPGYWDATFNTTTGLYENLAANALAEGQFNIFAVEVTLAKYCHKQLLLGSGSITLQSFDAANFGQGMRMKCVLTTRGADHEWWWNASLTLFRKKIS